LGKKLVKAAVKYNAKIIWIAGGVSANDRLFEYVNWLTNKYKNKKKLSSDVKVIRPVKKIYSTDNAAMIGAVGILKKLNLL
jgi:tRNA A37 threonylcarbamoyltransferase TsaD